MPKPLELRSICSKNNAPEEYFTGQLLSEQGFSHEHDSSGGYGSSGHGGIYGALDEEDDVPLLELDEELEDSLLDSEDESLLDSDDNSLLDSMEDSLEDSEDNSLLDSVADSLEDSLLDSVEDSSLETEDDSSDD